MNAARLGRRIRRTLISFALITTVVWVSVGILVGAAAPVVTDLMSELESVLENGATTLDESAGAVEDGGELIRGVEPGLDSTADGIAAASNSLLETRKSVNEMSAIFNTLGESLEFAGLSLNGSDLNRDPGIVAAGNSLIESGRSMKQAAGSLAAIVPDLDELVAEMGEVRITVLETAENTRPLNSSLGDAESALLDTGDALRSAAGKVQEVRTSGSIRVVIIMLFVLLGTMSVSLAIIAASRLSQMTVL